MIPGDFDRYRQAYSTMSYDQCVAWHSKLFDSYPRQKHFDAHAVERFMSDVGAEVAVAEIGGWDGALAQHLANAGFTIARWVNQEICEEARRMSVCDKPFYHATTRITCFHGFNTFVASHSLEHMSGLEVRDVLERALHHVEYAYIDAPTHPASGSTSLHILDNAWEHILPVFENWTQMGQRETARWFKR